ncbi:hypothetical protein K458DRAFT_408560 [Lentithecium fluviatile CBS 122367]|uniref:Uncharacterized protein n=1 Tax=Lentithecium fluviatile CBS 122367 TaxID=1168545 RepID=A0A6G1ILN8_9PLEO|nr:hypothetical protein K458DRAFT_408560 [Lentithecium fluviatile CBS 122367]
MTVGPRGPDIHHSFGTIPQAITPHPSAHTGRYNPGDNGAGQSVPVTQGHQSTNPPSYEVSNLNPLLASQFTSGFVSPNSVDPLHGLQSSVNPPFSTGLAAAAAANPPLTASTYLPPAAFQQPDGGGSKKGTALVPFDPFMGYQDPDRFIAEILEENFFEESDEARQLKRTKHGRVVVMGTTV